MRADRLLSLLMLLQARGRMTAKALAEKLEVSVRTIYRDIEALSMAGVPVYAETGRAGGFDLLDSYRTSLTGLNQGELSALFMLSIPAPLTGLQASQELQSALLKLSAAAPGTARQDESVSHKRIHLDWEGWEVVEEPLNFLRTIERALRQDSRLMIRFQPYYLLEVEQIVEPYGLVAKAGAWHLVYARSERTRVIRVAGLLDVKETGEPFQRRGDFDLEAFWEDWCTRKEQRRMSYPVILLVSADLAPDLPRYLPGRIDWATAALEPPDEGGRRRMQIKFESLWEARAALLGLGGAVEVLEPPALRASMADYARQIVERYFTSQTPA